ncbi:MAG TPA: DUF3696 domain-containing protein [Firmicutes bacterium]|nr:DUF3696 domain-containing protein [Bacillota bacterium]
MITKLSLKNFKSWEDTGEVTLAPLTGFFGSNSSGKTSLIQLLLLLKQTAESPDRNLVLHLGDDRSLVDLGTFQDVLYRHDLERVLEWRLDWKLSKPLRVEDPQNPRQDLFEGDELGFSAEIVWKKGKEGGQIVVKRMAYSFNEVDFGMEPVKERDQLNFKKFKLFGPNPDFFKRHRGRAWQLPPPAKCYGFPDQVRAYYQNAAFLSDFELEFEKLFAQVFYLGPLREYPKRQYSWAGAKPTDVGRRGERVVEAILASREGGYLYSFGRGRKRKSLEQVVAHWLKELNMIEDFAVRPIREGSKLYQVWVRRHPNAEEVLLADVGFGVSQILPVITLLYYVPEHSVVILEQPEIHLHPSVQAGLADVFIEVIQRRKIQIILESHSEYLLRRLQRRIAEERFSEKDVALFFCTMEGGRSRLEQLRVDMYGHIENWPEDFFGDELGEILRTQRAILERQRKTRKGELPNEGCD